MNDHFSDDSDEEGFLSSKCTQEKRSTKIEKKSEGLGSHGSHFDLNDRSNRVSLPKSVREIDDVYEAQQTQSVVLGPKISKLKHTHHYEAAESSSLYQKSELINESNKSNDKSGKLSESLNSVSVKFHSEPPSPFENHDLPTETGHSYYKDYKGPNIENDLGLNEPIGDRCLLSDKGYFLNYESIRKINNSFATFENNILHLIQSNYSQIFTQYTPYNSPSSYSPVKNKNVSPSTNNLHYKRHSRFHFRDYTFVNPQISKKSLMNSEIINGFAAFSDLVISIDPEESNNPKNSGNSIFKNKHSEKQNMETKKFPRFKKKTLKKDIVRKGPKIFLDFNDCNNFRNTEKIAKMTLDSLILTFKGREFYKKTHYLDLKFPNSSVHSFSSNSFIFPRNRTEESFSTKTISIILKFMKDLICRFSLSGK
ncbi:hypothetical protein AYI68_g8264 [Smittium mucronatum]|uniref:Uncharacterized protein n=1 Tax=Smittium mucronatum TaxID=133383 RepID=A0A1R0GLD3_9FUNG|nr:hypothetical protein AYI68_g8264 [Smittium mucronatum]